MPSIYGDPFHLNPQMWERRYDVADAAAAANWELVVVQMLEILPPVPMNSAADARATKANTSVYSIRSCP